MKKFQHVEHALRIHAGPESLTSIERELERLGAKKAVIFCGKTLSQSPLIKLAVDGAGSRCAGIYNGVKAHTPSSGVEEAADALRSHQADAVIAIGGGSAIVTARAASIYLAEGYNLDAMATHRDANGQMRSPKLQADKIPQLIVPTTPNTAMVKAGSAVFDVKAKQRKALFDPKTRSQVLFLHPDMLMSAPKDLILSASYDTLTLAVDGLLSKSGDTLSDASLMHCIRLLVDLLPQIESRDEPNLRTELTMAAVLCGRGTDHTGAGAATVLGHAIGANHDLENGIAKAVVLTHVLQYNEDHAQSGLIKMAAALGLAHGNLDAILAALRTMLAANKTPTRLRDLGIAQDALSAIATRGLEDWFLAGNPRPITKSDQLMEILTSAW